MDYPDLETCLKARPLPLSKGPLMVLLDEDGVEIAATVRHHLELGFHGVLVLQRKPSPLPEDPRILRTNYPRDAGDLPDAVTRVCQSVPQGTWIGHGFNGEFLFYPFCESRRIGEMLAFHLEERREAMTGMVIDLYAPDLSQAPLGVDLNQPQFDARGYYGLTREDPAAGHTPIDRQFDLYGGLRWRFEEHVPWAKRRIDRTMLFRSRKDLAMNADLSLNDPEMNEVECAWHRNLTCAMASFRTAKALMQSPGATAAIPSFLWPGSRVFSWQSQQLLDLGFIEPGQWF